MMENIFTKTGKSDWPLRDIFINYLEEVKPLLEILNQENTETEHFKLAIVFKCKFGVVGSLDYDWIKLHESSLNDKDFKSKLFQSINSYMEATGAVHDLMQELEWNNNNRFKNRISIDALGKKE